MKIEIKCRFTGVVRFSGECESLEDAAVKAKANLHEANLRGPPVPMLRGVR